MSPPDGQKNAADGLFMSGVCTVTGTFFLLSDFYQVESGCFHRAEEPKRLAAARIQWQRLALGSLGRPIIFNQAPLSSWHGHFATEKKILVFNGKKMEEKGEITLFYLARRHYNRIWMGYNSGCTPDRRNDRNYSEKANWSGRGGRKGL